MAGREEDDPVFTVTTLRRWGLAVRLPSMTIRRWMVAVAVVALVLAPALFVWRSKDLEDNLT